MSSHRTVRARPPRVLVTLATALCASALLSGTAVAAPARHATAAKVTVTFTDTRLGLSTAGLEAGPATFVFVNKGKKLHYLEISGPGTKIVRSPSLAPGKSATVTLKLRSGAYMLSLSQPSGLSHASSQWLQVIPPVAISAKGGSNVVQEPGPPISPVCGGLMP